MMEKKDTGGPAFPTTKPLDSWGDPNQGMDLRDYFAAKAMQAWLTGVDSPLEDKCVEFAYRMADAMLKARKA
jgi:hypothetical protein